MQQTKVAVIVNEECNKTDGGLNSSNQYNIVFPPKLEEPKSWLSSVHQGVTKKSLKTVILVALTVIITTVIILALDKDCSVGNKSSDENVLLDAKPLRIVTRNEWMAQPPKEELTLLNLPVQQVIISHSATEGCNTQTSCVYRVRFIQEQHIGINNYGDIGCNFLIGGDGQVYEGRGWLKVGAFLRGQNGKSIGIAFIGDYRRYEATKDQLEALNSLLVNGTNSGYLTADFKLYGANQLQITESPGTMLYEQIKKHKHWNVSPPINF